MKYQTQSVSIKKILPAIIAAVFLSSPSLCFASYVIHLKYGRDFVTDQYWEEGDQIKFKRFGGEVGIHKNRIRDIKEVEDVPGVEVKENTDGEVEAKAKEEGENGNNEGDGARDITEKGKEKEVEPKIDIAYYKKMKKELMEEYNKTKKNLNEAILNHDVRARLDAKKALKEIHQKYSKLMSELKSANNGVLPPWWHDNDSNSDQSYAN